MTAAAGVALIALGGIVFMTARFVSDSDDADKGDSTFALAPTTRAAAPFTAFDEARVAVDEQCKRLLIARTIEQRVQGLRDVEDLAPYDGMLFVFPADS